MRDIDQAIALLKQHGYRVTTPRAEKASGNPFGASPAKRTGKAHGHCRAHYRMPGYSTPVCVLGARTIEGVHYPPQREDDVLSFAQEIARIAARSGDVLRQLRMGVAA